ncbi:MAG TPA: hypothetical protein VMJ10_24450 [Kofleriaceae bacterium]|nr:hypothetical protein [Kofleriaceae bacterium]
MGRALLVLALLAHPAFAQRPHKHTGTTTKPATTPSGSSSSGHQYLPADPESPDAAAVLPDATHNEGEYGGVTPGQPRRAEPSKKPTRPPPKGTLSWIGFQPGGTVSGAKDGGAEVFFQSVAPFDVTQHVEGGVLLVYLAGLSRLGQNTWRPIDARFFETPIARISARRVGAAGGKNAHPAGIEVRVTFKNAKDAKEGTYRSATEADGLYYAYLSFAGSAPADAGGTMQQPEQ